MKIIEFAIQKWKIKADSPTNYGKYNKKWLIMPLFVVLAERKGFEPLIRFPVYTISSRAP